MSLPLMEKENGGGHNVGNKEQKKTVRKAHRNIYSAWNQNKFTQELRRKMRVVQTNVEFQQRNSFLKKTKQH